MAATDAARPMDGTAPFAAEAIEFIDAFLKSAGVVERVGVPLGFAAPLRGLRIALLGRGVLGVRLTAGLKGLGTGVDPAGFPFGERDDFLSGVDVDSERFVSD